ncbi:MAG: hypothetical protein LUF86_05920, partial [Clostridiales bacterium]|nr:hypothetical protein [Clostridiales bacterium]
DDSLIDSSNATVTLVDGDGYYAAEFIFSATTLTGSWENGQTSYTMDVEDLVWDNTVYSGEMGDATRQWSAFGGDGNGCYTFYLEVSGITYNGQEVASTTFPVEIYIFGRDGTDRGTVFDDEVSLPTATESSSGKSQSSETQWTWSGDSSAGVPILCDSLADDFYITWPSGSDASGVTADDVTVTLSNEYGTTYTLETENAYGEVQYVVYSSEGETQVAVTFMHWAYTPVFTTMTITVDGDGLTATKTYDVASVYAYIVQSGGRASGDGNTVTYSFYGLDLDSLTDVYQLAKDTEDYTLYTTVDDTTYYYAEDEDGTGYLTTDEDEAAVYTQSTEVREPALVNSTVFIENRLTLTEDKTVDGETVTFTKELGNGDGNNNLYMKGEDVLANGVKAAAGYVIGENLTPYDGNGDRYGTLMPYEHWAWQTRFSAGWTSEDGETATSFPYVSFPYGYAAGETPSTGSDEEEEEAVEVSVTAESDIFGSADTGNKSTLKAALVKTSGPGDTYLYYYNEDGERVQYEDQTATYEADTVTYTGSATISLALSEGDIDDSLIDSSNAVVALAEGDGYYPDELVLAATSLTGSWENGQMTYTLSEGDLEWYTGDYEWSDYNSGREWSCFGGDGNGYYTFNFEVSGITYNGVEIDPVQFQVNVYIWGRDGSDRVSTFNETESPEAVESASGVSQTDEIQWTWSGDTTTGDPILCDNLADDFYITWPSGTDASGLTADDVTVTLYNDYGDSYTLQTENAYGEKQYSVFSSEGETQVAVTFMHWAYVPVFTTMTITVDGDGLTASKTYDVDSVYIYMVQQGGGGVTVDGTVTTYSYYGFDNLDDIWQIMTESTYVLTTTIDDTTYYYAEDGTLTTDKSEAQSFDATGEDDTNQQLIGNTAWITTRLNQTEDKTVDGETITFDKSYSNGSTANATTAAANGLVAADGYILGSSITPYEMWAWQDRFLAGYTTSEAEPTGSPYVSFPYGYEAGSTDDDEEEEETVVPTASAESTLFGYAYTDGLSCLMSDTIDSLTGEATISLTLDEGNIDDSLIDSSNATVTLVDGDTYYADEMTLSATTLTGSWENGQTTYTLDVEDLVWNNSVYTDGYSGGTREWSCFGGDGNGCYTYNLEVSGITYNGQEVPSVTFQVEVYIFGRSGADLAALYNLEEDAVAVESSSGVSQTDEIQWTWSGDTSAGVPILCDGQTDDFYITWPTGTDASSLTAENVTVTLYSEYGDSYTLQTENAYGEEQYAVFSSEGETQVAVMFRHWAYAPVFTTMTITVDGDDLTASQTYEIGSVYVHMVKSGGHTYHE